MYIKQEKKGWMIQFAYEDWTGKRVRTTKRGFKTKKEAQEWYSHFMVLKRGDMNMAFEDFVNNVYMPDMETRLKEHTIIQKKYMIDLKLLPYFGKKNFSEISVSDIRSWQQELIGKGYAPTYLKTLNNQLSAIFNYATRYYNLKNNACKIAGSMGKSQGEKMELYTRQQFDEFCNQLMNKRISWMAYQTLYFTGLRVGELLALQIKDVDFDKKILIVRKSLQRLKRRDVITEPKTPKSNRNVNLPEFLLVDLQDYIVSMMDVSPEERLFPCTKSFLEHELKRGISEGNLPHTTIHSFRHMHASLLIEMGFSPIAVAERLGHEKVSTTLNTYGHLFPNKQAGMAEKLNDFYREGL